MLSSLMAVDELLKVMVQQDVLSEKRQAAVAILDRAGLKPYSEDESRAPDRSDLTAKIEIVFRPPVESSAPVIDLPPGNLLKPGNGNGHKS